MIDPNSIPLEARRAIVKRFGELPIFKRSRGCAVYNFFAALEQETSVLTANPQAIYALGRRAIEACHRAIPAIFSNCHTQPEDEMRLNPAAVHEATELLKFSYKFDQVMLCYELADRGQYTVAFDPASSCIKFAYASDEASQADTLLRSKEVASKWEKQLSEADVTALGEIVTAIRAVLIGAIMYVAPNAIAYQFAPNLLALAERWAAIVARTSSWDLPENLPVGSLTLKDVKKFWGAVGVIASVHDMAHLVASNGDTRLRPQGSVVHVRSVHEWAELIARIGGIEIDAASEMLSWYTFDPVVSGNTALIQPFIEAAPGFLCTNMTWMANLDSERNLSKLVSRHPKLRTSLSAMQQVKEGIALTFLSSLFPTPQFATAPTVVLKGVTDADLLVYERSSGFVLVIQHKWLTAPETANESTSNDEQLSEGVTQALKARDAFRQDHGLVRKALGLVPSDAVSNIEGVVISRESESTGFLGQSAIPIVLESAFVDLWAATNSLAQLWKNLNERPDHAMAATQFDDTYLRIDIEGFSFLAPFLIKEVKL